MTPLPGRERMLLQEFALASEAWRTRIWRQGQISTAYVSNTEESAVSMGQTDPTGSRLLAYSYDPDGGNTRALMVDLEECADTCATAPAVGIPYWSPTGERALYVGDSNTFPGPLLTVNERVILLDGVEAFTDWPIALGPGRGASAGGLTNLGQGASPFWIDETTFGFVRRVLSPARGSRGDVEIVVGSLDDSTLQTVLTGSDLSQFLPNDAIVRRTTIAYVTANPNWPGKLFIVVVDRQAENAFVFFYDLTTGLPELRLTAQADFNHSLGFSPDGRYLVVTGTGYQPNDPDSNLAPLLLHDIAANRTIPLLARLPYFLPSVVYDWTPDGLLAVALDENLIGLIDPDSGGVRLLGHNQGACTSVAWLAE